MASGREPGASEVLAARCLTLRLLQRACSFYRSPYGCSPRSECEPFAVRACAAGSRPRQKPPSVRAQPILLHDAAARDRLNDMARTIPLDDLTAEERIELIGRLWDSLDPARAAPMTRALAAELDRREAEADASPDDGDAWPEIRDELRKKLR